MSGSQGSNSQLPLTTTAHQPVIDLCIASQDGDKVYYRNIRRDKRIKGLLLDYCQMKNYDYNLTAFLHDGRRIRVTKTPDELGLENGDEIDAMCHHTGGVGSNSRVE